jgi:hypothetical protein
MSGRPAKGGDPRSWSSTPFSVGQGWTPTVDVYAEVYTGTVQESAVNDSLLAVEGWGDVEGTITLTRSPFFGAEDLIRAVNAAAVTNGASGNVFSLGDVFGDLAAEGEPINVTLAKPASGTAAGVIVASVASRSSLSIAGALSGITNTTTGSAFASSSTFDVSAIRRLLGVELRLLARLHTLTSPSKGQIQAEVQTSGGVALWRSPWVSLGSDATGQLIELGGAPLDMLRVPLPSATAANIKIGRYGRQMGRRYRPRWIISTRCWPTTTVCWSRQGWRLAKSWSPMGRRT